MRKGVIAKVLKTGLMLGYYTNIDVIIWADKLINEGDDDLRLIDISLAGNQNTNTIIEILNLIEEPEACETVKMYYFSFFNKLLEEQTTNWLSIERELLRFIELIPECILDFERDYFSRLHNDYSLRKEKLQSPMIMPQDLESFLKSYIGFDAISQQISQANIKSLTNIPE
jgi:hypothetical protein